MKGLGMREIDRHRGRKHSGQYDRPKWFVHNGVNYRVPSEYHSNVPCASILSDEYGMPSPVTRKYLDDPGRSSEGLHKNPLRRLFEYERSLWPSHGFISPYKDDSGRARRDEREYELWLLWNRGRIEEMMNQDVDEEIDWPHNRAINYAKPRGGLPGVMETPRRRARRMHRPTREYNRPPHRPHGSVDPRDPINRPPVIPNAMNSIPRVTNSLPSSLYENVGDRHPRRRPTNIRLPGPRNTQRTSHPVYGTRRYGEPPGRLGPHIVDHRGHSLRRRNPFIHDDDLQDEGRTEFITPHPGFHREPRIHRPHRFSDDEDEDEDEEDTRSHFSTGSYTRLRHDLPPRIVYPPIYPYHGRPLDRHHEVELDDEDEDELFHSDGDYVHRGRVPYGIGIGRESRRARVGRRGYDLEDLDYGLSGDEDEYLLRH